jgi:hypothetical protein
MSVKGYKAFDEDFKCRGMQYKVGETYEFDGEISLCESGYHFCKNIADCFKYYKQTRDRFAEVVALGEVVESEDDSKCVTNKIRIVAEISHDDAVRMSNTGDRNTGNWNTGDRNTGDRNTGDRNTGNRNTGNRNTGDRNTGDWNTGDRNTGDWNTGDRNTGDWNTTSFSSGCFCTEESKILMFNRQSNWTMKDWLRSEARSLLCQIPHNVVEWIWSDDMTDEEKEAHPEHTTTGGYLKILEEAENAQNWWSGLSESDRNVIRSIPNFDPAIFKQCTGIDVNK